MKQGVLCKSGQMRRTSSDGPSVSRWLPLLCAAALGLMGASAVHADVLSVLTPNGGEVWAPGSVQTVSWSVDTGSGTGEVGAEVKIELWQGDSVSSVLAWIVAAADGSFSWSIPSSQAEGSDYRVKVYSRTDLSVADFSDGYFTIQAPTLTVESPNGGETWYGGETQSITWSTDGDVGAEVKIELWAGGALDRVLAWVVAAGDGSYSWAIPGDLAAGADYQVKVYSRSNLAIADMSDGAFAIGERSITLTAPNGGETWEAGADGTVTWTATGDVGDEVKLELWKGGALERVMAYVVATGGRHVHVACAVGCGGGHGLQR